MIKPVNLLFALLLPLTILAQERTIKGKITAFNKFPLKGVKVSAKKAKAETFTDESGMFNIACKKNDVLKIEAGGFQRETIKPGDENIIQLNMIYQDNGASFKSVIEGGHMTEQDLEYAIKNLMQENNDYSRYQSIYELIQSKYPLAKVVENGGFKRIYLTSQGPSSLEAQSHALIVVDGVITENISGIVPAQVAAFRVITGAEASMYGTRGGNGVIEIELKH